MTDLNLSLALKNKILGALLRDARQLTGKQIEECAAAIGIDPEAYLAMEDGISAPSLPQIESLAYFMDVPLEHFFGSQPLSEDEQQRSFQDTPRLILIRQRIIGSLLKQARLEKNLSIEDTVEITHIDADTMHEYEQGVQSIPLPVLESICAAYNLPVQELTDRFGPVGKWDIQKRAVKEVSNIPLGLQEFISQPANLPYLELAQKLSNQDLEKMRLAAEKFLEITR